jgi:hypothetical protein
MKTSELDVWILFKAMLIAMCPFVIIAIICYCLASWGDK